VLLIFQLSKALVAEARLLSRRPAVAGVTVSTGSGFSLRKALDIGLPKCIDGINEVSENASKEFALERSLDAMQVAPEAQSPCCLTCSQEIDFFSYRDRQA
jgi:hypothetical protein